MPFYDFEDTKTGEIQKDMLMSVSEMEKHLADNPHIKLLILGAPNLGDSIRMGMKKPDAGFRDLLKDIKKRNSRGRNKVNTF